MALYWFRLSRLMPVGDQSVFIIPLTPPFGWRGLQRVLLREAPASFPPSVVWCGARGERDHRVRLPCYVAVIVARQNFWKSGHLEWSFKFLFSQMALVSCVPCTQEATYVLAILFLWNAVSLRNSWKYNVCKQCVLGIPYKALVCNTEAV